MRLEHGPQARILAAERVSPHGIGRFRAAPYIEATVSIPGTPPRRRVTASPPLGITALLARTDQAEDRLRGEPAREIVGPTSSAEFDEIIDQISSFTGVPLEAAETPARPAESIAGGVLGPTIGVRVPALPARLRIPGDLVVVVGIGQDALPVAQAMARQFSRGDVRGGGLVKARGKESLTDRRSALLARAEGVDRGRIVYCAFGIAPDGDFASAVAAIDADQVWVVVDAGRKPADTAAWVQAIAAVTGVHAVAVVGTSLTATPETVEELGYPVGWSDGAPVA